MSKKPPPRPDLAALDGADRSGGLPLSARQSFGTGTAPPIEAKPAPTPAKAPARTPAKPRPTTPPEPEPDTAANVAGILSDPLVFGARRRLNAHMAKACDECDGLGWAVFLVDRAPTYEIERCDTCKAYEDDRQAVAAAALLLALLVSGEHHTLTDVQRESVRDAARCLGDDWYTAKNGGHRASA
jgi:hypothetical protein